ncbi:MAG: potassium channel family protein [archaeon]
MELLKQLLSAILILIVLLAAGTVIYSHTEGWRYLDSLYFTVITVTTIGYGDFVPQTGLGKLFTVFFVFLGIALVFLFFSIVGRYMVEKVFETKIKEHIKKHTHKK